MITIRNSRRKNKLIKELKALKKHYKFDMKIEDKNNISEEIEEEKPKRKRRTKAEIEAENKK